MDKLRTSFAYLGEHPIGRNLATDCGKVCVMKGED